MKQDIIVIDDTLLSREMMTRVLLKKGYNVVAQGEDGLDALDLYSVYKPDILIMDLHMPVFNGYDSAIEILRRYPEAKIFMFTSVERKDTMMQELFGYGVVNHIPKPFNIDSLNSILLSGISKAIN